MLVLEQVWGHLKLLQEILRLMLPGKSKLLMGAKLSIVWVLIQKVMEVILLLILVPSRYAMALNLLPQFLDKGMGGM